MRAIMRTAKAKGATRWGLMGFLAAGLLTVAACAPADDPNGNGNANGNGNGGDEPAPEPIHLDYLPNPTVPPAIDRDEPALVEVELEIQEVEAKLADGSAMTHWTYNGTVPGPFIRVREGDTVELTIRNPEDSLAPHNIDLHAVTGPGGGAEATLVNPGEEKTFRFKATNPGLYVYHCATPPIPHHIMAGMYGLILVEPAEGMDPVDKEFYVMQGDIYTQGETGAPGMQQVDMQKMAQEAPDYVVFNGAVGSLTGERALQAEVGDKVRIYFGVGGPNLVSSFHVIGEIFDTVYPEGALGNPVHNVQTTLVPAGGATMVEFTLQVPGDYILVDHSLSRLDKGAAGILQVTGEENPEIFDPMDGQ